MDLRPPVSPLGFLFQKLLHPVLAADGKPRADGLLDARGIVHFRCAHQHDLSRLPAGSEGGRSHPRLHRA